MRIGEAACPIKTVLLDQHGTRWVKLIYINMYEERDRGNYMALNLETGEIVSQKSSMMSRLNVEPIEAINVVVLRLKASD